MDKGKINETGNLSNTNVKPGGPGMNIPTGKESVTTLNKVNHEAAKNDGKNTWTKNSGNKGGASTHAASV